MYFKIHLKKFTFGAMTALFLIITLLIISELFLKYFDPLKVQIDPERVYEYRRNKDQSYSFLLKHPGINREKVDPYIKVTRNSMGLRGSEPKDDGSEFKIVAMGGSTTECIVLSDGQTWTDLLQENFQSQGESVWVGNAGMNGQSSFGHLRFLKEYIINLKPRVIIFLMGANEQNEYYYKKAQQGVVDFGKEKGRFSRQYRFKEKGHSQFLKFIENYKQYSYILKNFSEIRRRTFAKKFNLGYIHDLDNQLAEAKYFFQVNPENEVNYKQLPRTESKDNRGLEELKQQSDYLKQVKNNLNEIINISKSHEILPIFITQPALFGKGIDPTTGVDLGKMILQDGNVQWSQGLSGFERWTMLNHYNNIIRQAAKKNEIPLIDLAMKLPRDSAYYYDFIHYSKSGAKEVAKIIYPELCEILNKRNMLKTNCK
jgi:lysophospholipase L1-like esterase